MFKIVPLSSNSTNEAIEDALGYSSEERIPLTKEILHDSPVCGACSLVPQNNEICRRLANTKLLPNLGEAKRGVGRIGGLNAGQARHRRLGDVDGVLPVAAGLTEYGRIKDEIVAKEGVLPAETGVVLEDVVPAQIIQRELIGHISVGARPYGGCVEEGTELGGDVEARIESRGGIVLRDVLAVVREVVVVREGIQHGTRTADWGVRSR